MVNKDISHSDMNWKFADRLIGVSGTAAGPQHDEFLIIWDSYVWNAPIPNPNPSLDEFAFFSRTSQCFKSADRLN